MNRLQKFVVTGALVLAPVLSVSAASAATPATVTLNQIDQSTVNTIAQKYGFDLSSLLQGNPSNIYWGGLVIKYPFQYGSGNAGHWNSTPDAGGTQGSTEQPGSANNADNGAATGNTDENSADSGTAADTTPGTTTDTPAANTGSTDTSNGGSSQGTATETTGTSASYASQVVDLVNQERTKAGLKPLTSDSALTNVALAKAKDMYTNNYFDHTSPTYGSPFDMMKSFGISYTYAGENIAKGQRNPQEVMTAWMNSAGHRQNILSPNYTKIGVAYFNGEWVQEFIAN
ncbi:CAP domain-containing protein [Paenibacillus rigui]|uniref:CAP domain-containing protein n=1 Tax=Paenibacillus rigui TaxID=554312 RepID=UPI0026A8A022